MKQALNILIAYLTCTDPVIQNKWLNLLSSFWHKDSGWLLKSITAQAGGYKFIIVDSDGNDVDHIINIPTIPNSQPISYIQDLQTTLDNKVDKVAGKGLSTNDFTTTLKNKLDGLANYVHPDFHQISEIEGLQDILDTFAVYENLAEVAKTNNYEDLDNKPVFKVVQNEYPDMAALYAGQGNQSESFIQYVADASAHPDVEEGSAYFEYFGTTEGDETDYRLLSSAESAPISVINNGSSAIGNGNVINLNNPLVTYYNMDEALGVLEYTLDQIANGGKARLFVNAPSLPNIVGGTKIKGDEFQANTPIYIEVENSGGRIEYWVKQIYESPFEDITGLPFGKIVDSSTNPVTDYVGTPCIIQTTTGRIIMSHDIYGASASKVGWGTILVSDDMGQTFTKTLEVASLFWGNLFEYEGKIFIIYTSNFTLGGAYNEGDIAMRYSTDDGDTWSSEIILFSDDGTFRGYLTHATNVVIKDGYMAMGVMKADTFATFANYIKVGVMYGDLTDLTTPSNYSLSSFQSLNTSLYPIKIGTTASATKRPSNATALKGHLEPCLVEHASGIRMHCRLEQTPNSGYSVYYDVAWNSSNPPLSVISTTPYYHEMFGGQLKFQITWDETSSKFWTIVNWNKVKYFTDNRYELFLAYSTNAIDWTICKKVGGWEYSSAWETEITNKGTQYVSFIIIDNDIYFAARTTSDSGANQHDADLLTLTKILDFRSAIPQTFVDGSLILDENSTRLENGSGIGVIFDQSKYQNAAYMLTANNANKVSWVSGLNFTGSQYMRVPHNEYLDPVTNGISVFVVVENLQSTSGLRILSKSDGSPATTVDINAKDWSFNPQGMTIGNCYTDGYTDISTGNNYILASSYDKITNTIWNYRNGVNRGSPPSLTGGTWSIDHINKTDSYAGRTTAEMYIGKRNVGTSLNFTSKIKALHIIPRYMTPTEMIDYQNELNTIYSIY